MAKYRKKPEFIEATLWPAPGDPPEFVTEGVRNPEKWAKATCAVCEVLMREHGRIERGDRPDVFVCPGYWVIKDDMGRVYTRNPETFAATYEPVEG